MSRLLDEVGALTVTAASPSGAVSVTITRDTGMRVSLDVGRVSGHTEATLAEEVENAVLNAWSQRTEALKKIAHHHGLDASRWDQSTTATARDALGEIEAAHSIGVSKSGHVEAQLHGDGDLVIKFHDNAVRRTDVDTQTLEPDINEAIADAMRAFREVLKAAPGTR